MLEQGVPFWDKRNQVKVLSEFVAVNGLDPSGAAPQPRKAIGESREGRGSYAMSRKTCLFGGQPAATPALPRVIPRAIVRHSSRMP